MINKFSAFGIPDEFFARDSVPMTKEEVRAVIFSKLRVLDNNKILDIGSGTGSLSIQAALFAKNGIVYSIEKDQNAIDLINENINKLEINNIKIIKDTAPVTDSDLKDFDRIIISGSGGNLKSILEWSYGILKSSGRIVIPAITLNTLKITEEFLENNNFKDIGISLIAVSKFEKKGKNRMLKANYPVFVISGEKNG